MIQKKIPVFLASDEKYAPFIATTIASIMDHTKSFVSFYILDSGVSQSAKSKIASLKKRWKNFDVEYLNVDVKLFFPNAKTSNHYSLAMYNRYLIPLLKPEISKAIYSDVDVIFNADIKDFYDINVENFGLAAPIEEIGMPLEGIDNHIVRKKKFGITPQHKYFQSGNLLINCDYWRKNHITQKLIDATYEYEKDLQYPDLDVLNIVFANNYKILDYKYSFCTHRTEDVSQNQEMLNAEKFPFLFHYASSRKPWNTPNVPYSVYFWKYAKITPFYRRLRLLYFLNILKWRKEKNSYGKKIKLFCFPLFSKNKETGNISIINIPISKIYYKIKLKKRIIKILTCCIWKKDTRKKVQNTLSLLSLKSLLNLARFCFTSVRGNSVLLVEPNDCHAEVGVGYAKYLLDLGYNVDVLMSEKNVKEHPFKRIETKQIKLFSFCPIFLKYFFNKDKIKKYKFIFVTSSRFLLTYDYSKIISLKDKIGFWPKGQSKTLIVEHDITDIPLFNLQEFDKNKQIVTLGKFSKGIYVNPHYFGTCKKHKKNKATTFIVVGGINPEQKNHRLLIDAVDIICQHGYHCKINVIGRGRLNDIPNKFRNYFNLKGFLSFPKMYEQVETADFFLPLLDCNNSQHNRYITTGVTGSAQLIYGFNIPCLIQQKFADFYGFNDKNSLIYEEDLASLMIKAIEMSEEEYQDKKKNLKILSDSIYEQSLQNLRKIIK